MSARPAGIAELFESRSAGANVRVPMFPSTVSSAVTDGIRITVASHYVADRSHPASQRYAFAYTVKIHNESDRVVKLITRHWVVTHGDGKIEEVRGAGVVGEQPVLKPGQSFEYTSGCMLTTARGTMHGTYRMVEAEGKQFDAKIAPFALEMPYAIN